MAGLRRCIPAEPGRRQLIKMLTLVSDSFMFLDPWKRCIPMVKCIVSLDRSKAGSITLFSDSTKNYVPLRYKCVMACDPTRPRLLAHGRYGVSNTFSAAVRRRLTRRNDDRIAVAAGGRR